MQETNFWTRVSHWFKSESSLPDSAPRVSQVEPIDSAGDSPPPAESGWLARKSDRHAITSLEDRYAALASLVDSIHNHLRTQDQRTLQMADALSHLAETIARFPETLEAQKNHLATVAQQLESANKRAAQWDVTIKQIPNLAELQQQTLHSLREQADHSKSAQTQIAQSMDAFKEAVSAVSQASSSSVQTMRDMQRAAAENHERLTGLVDRHSRKFSRLLLIAISVAGALGLAAVLVLLLK